MEKLAYPQHEEWLARRQKVTPARIAQAMAILDKPTGTSSLLRKTGFPMATLR